MVEPERSLPCPACGATRFRSLLPLNDASGYRNALVRCTGCQLVVAASEPTPRELESYYESYSYASEEAWNVSPATEAALAGLAKRLQPFRSSARLLDVGCGAGVILEVMARHGWSAEGTELSALAADRLRARGHRVHLGRVEELELPERSYDVVVLSELIEHLLDPRSALSASVRLLRPGGAVYLTTPNYDSLSRRLLGARWRVLSLPEHLCYFNRRSLTSLLRRVGLRPMGVVTEGISPFELLAAARPLAAPAPVGERTEQLRQMSAGSGPLAPLKGLVNSGLRLASAGDTLKALAVRPGDQA